MNQWLSEAGERGKQGILVKIDSYSSKKNKLEYNTII